MKKFRILAPIVMIVALIGWYAFRPERLVINQTVNESLPTAQAAMPEQPLASGMFHGVAHETSGKATVYRLGDGTRMLRFSNFKTSNGPDVHVYLVAADDAKDNDTVKRAGFIDLGSIKGNIGNQNYALPADLDLSKYRSATIWCRRFGVNFGTAPLMAGSASAQKPIRMGNFHGVAHETSGTAAIYQLADGSRILRFSNFKTSNGPDVHVYLVAADDAKDNDTVKRAGFIDLGSIKGNIGDQNYTLPSDVDLTKYSAATVWCKRFGVNFGTAPLAGTEMAAAR
ncbi:MAG: DM13 domain-containing protein [Terriglobales bacterium]